ncbi:DUF4167 domain-containing protein [Daeguia caeni]|uniref:DUF4167 domain-containing protein n=1 Tax=Daeguia caeni TaxID=439612 RepID=A0ABV9H8J0_9HYPH
MRPAQQNRRMRGRGNNNNRKGPNPLSRNYESNGPDVKIRGNAQHIAEKYTALARDAQASGDRVMAENYLQHAEHYNRIILAAMAQNSIALPRDDFDDIGLDDDDMGFAPVVQQPVNGSGPQPIIEGTPAEVVFGEETAEQVKPAENRQQDNRQARDFREQRRMARGRRPQRERYNAQERGEEGAQEGQVQASEEESPRLEQQAEAPVVIEVTPVETQPIEAEAEAPKPSRGKASAAQAETVEDEGEAPRRATRRPGRPRKTARAEADAVPAREAVASDS